MFHTHTVGLVLSLELVQMSVLELTTNPKIIVSSEEQNVHFSK